MAPYNTNLLKNWDAADELSEWILLQNGGDGFSVELDGYGSKPLSSVDDIRGCNRCWATSYDWCEKKQIVDLLACGFSAETLDRYRPHIIVKDWVSARNGCVSQYVFFVKLLSASQTELVKFRVRQHLVDHEWKKIKHTFKNYPPGVRFVDLMHGGKDTKSWAGHYGAKMAATSVVLKK